MRIGELAERAGVSCDTLRLYERQGLIQADRRANGYRDFPAQMLEVVQLIRLAQSLGFTLAEIGGLMRGMAGAMSQEEVAALLRDKLAEIDGRIAGLQELRGVIAARLEQACPLGWGTGQSA
jgi:MerR family copper efflux transcriptional regulator